ncbi:MAG: hypothetical protein KAJ20_02475, partial [Candidatus Aenigmarchaeota archaeon]|nr:hypothetical protein [Candidatus Aenigmarchaeota archaeon]
PLGVYRILFISLMSILTGTTIFLLYIFLFVMMLGWGYKEMYVKGKTDITIGQVHMDEMKHAQHLSQNLDSEIKNAQNRLYQIDNEIQSIVKDCGTLKKAMNKGGKIMILKNEQESLNHHVTLLLAQKKEKNERIHEHFTKLTTS